MPLMPWQKKAKDDGTEQLEVTLPDETQKKLDKALSVGEELEGIKTQLSGLSKVTEFIEAFKEKDEAEKRKAAAESHKKQQESEDAELSELILTDPKAAIAKATGPQAQAIMLLHASNIKRDVFDNAEKFPYYSGDIKSEVDKLLAMQTIQSQTDPSVVENCYYTVLGKHQKELAEGKLKQRFASPSGNSGTKGGDLDSKGEGSKPKVDITDDIRRAARFAGVTPEVYADMLVDSGVPIV